jgi:hypothetical protein
MTEQAVRDRAELLSQMAPHASVSAAVLLGDEAQFPESRLVSDAPVTYLDETEAPAHVLTNEKRGVALGTKRNGTKPDSGRGTVVLVTGRRTLCLVGTEPEDAVFEVAHPSVAAVSYHTGLLANRLEIRTSSKILHCWVDRRTDEADLQAVTEYIENRMGKSREELVDDQGADDGVVTYRGEALDQNGSNAAESSSTETAENGDADGEDSQVMYRGRPVDSSYFD